MDAIKHAQHTLKHTLKLTHTRKRTTRTQKHARMNTNAHKHTNAPTHAHARTHARTNSRTHVQTRTQAGTQKHTHPKTYARTSTPYEQTRMHEQTCATQEGVSMGAGGQGRECSNTGKTSCRTHPDLNWATRVKSAGRPVRPLSGCGDA